MGDGGAKLKVELSCQPPIKARWSCRVTGVALPESGYHAVPTQPDIPSLSRAGRPLTRGGYERNAWDEAGSRAKTAALQAKQTQAHLTKHDVPGQTRQAQVYGQYLCAGPTVKPQTTVYILLRDGVQEILFGLETGNMWIFGNIGHDHITEN
ncbi:hypothetical protein DPEC_G00315770 [Dallia pectoralis]|uniref:Uncharacterized protein n=1 Tax=Dallia pectoralis TaxID=75939 RepID=A0ACC2FCJ8_DALPE|nr:hypothetical protein DPEC_G00315770 [Dallia pectoralis]